MGKKVESKRVNLQQQADELLRRAADKGIQTNFFFMTTFKRYQVQMRLLGELEKQINEDGVTVTKEYVRGRQNIYTNPAISEYNKTATAANGTVATLINILKAFSDETGGKSKLMQMMAGLDE